MDAAYISTLSGLVGVIFGGLTSVSTAWITQRSQRAEAVRAKRASLFEAFIGEATRLYGDALSHEKDDVGDLVLLYALVARIRLLASRQVVIAAEGVMDAIVDTYLAPNRNLREMRDMAKNGKMNLLLEFGEAARAELLDRF